MRLHLQQFYAMFLKRALYSLRNWKVMVAQFLVPLVFTIVALVVARTIPDHQKAPRLSLALGRYGATRVPVALPPGPGPLAAALAQTYSSQLPAQLGQLVNITGEAAERAGSRAATRGCFCSWLIARLTKAKIGSLTFLSKKFVNFLALGVILYSNLTITSTILHQIELILGQES